MPAIFPSLRCPKCGSAHLHCLGKRYALYPSGCVVILSIPFSWLHRLSSPYEFDCRDCGQRFGKRTLPAKITFIILWILISLIPLGFVLAFIEGS